jgi:hypothetical protein
MNLTEQAAWLRNFNQKLQGIGASFGLTPAELDVLDKDTANIQFYSSVQVQLDAYRSAARHWGKSFAEGSIGDPTPQFPADLTLAPPFPDQPAGAFERLDAVVRRIRAAAVYTGESAASLGITPRRRERLAIHATPPELKASVEPGNLVRVAFIRGSSHGVYIETNVDKAGWAFADKSFVSPAVVTVQQNDAQTPRGVQIRARYLDGNTPVGDFSDIVTVQTIP